jgi:hypothetical protein
MRKGRTRTARRGRPAPLSWGRPKRKRQPARSMRAQAASRARRLGLARPSRSRPVRPVRPEAVQSPTKAAGAGSRHPWRARPAPQTRRKAIPRSVLEALVRLGPVPKATRLREAPAQRAAARPKTALWGRPGVPERRVRPRWVPVALQSLPSWRLPKVARMVAVAPRTPRPTGARPTAADPPVRRVRHPRSARPGARARAALASLPAHSTRAVALRWEVPEQPREPTGIPRWARPTSRARTPAGPSWAPTPDEPRPSQPRGSARALRQGAPRWWRCPPGDATGSRRTEAAGTMGARGAPPSCA